ncbi:MAG: hypothetical protein AABZ01_00040, partial [Gemmatimonadota bacterium]
MILDEKVSTISSRAPEFLRKLKSFHDRAIGRPGLVLGVSAALFLVSVGALGTLGSELIPELHQGRFTAEVALPVGTP